MTDSGSPIERIDDIDLAAAIAVAFQMNPRVSNDIEIDVTEGVVTLYGSVGRRDERYEAEAVVRDFRGVVEIVNRIELRERRYLPGFSTERRAKNR